MFDTQLDWMESTWLNHFATGYTWTWPVMETLHFFGLGLLLGIIVFIDLRMMGFFRRIVPLRTVHDLLPWAIIGFVINLLTGIVFLFGDPYRYYYSLSFRLKVLCLLIAGLNALWYWLTLNKKIDGIGDHAAMPYNAKIMGFVSIVAWVGVVVFGRLIPYL